MEFDPAQIAHEPTTGVRRVHETPFVTATDDSLKGYGCLVDDPESFSIEIVRWPAQGWRPVDPNSGDQGDIAEGSSTSSFKSPFETVRRKPADRSRRL